MQELHLRFTRKETLRQEAVPGQGSLAELLLPIATFLAAGTAKMRTDPDLWISRSVLSLKEWFSSQCTERRDCRGMTVASC